MTIAIPLLSSPARTRPAVTIRRRVRPRPVADLTSLTRYRGGTYSHTVDRIVFADGTSARTDLIRLNPGVEAYSLDFAGVAPDKPSRYRVDTWTSVANLRTRAHEAEVDWILRNSFPMLTVAELSRRLRAAGQPLGTANIAEHEAIAATQAAIWLFTNGKGLDNRPRNEPDAVLRTTDGVTVEFAAAPELGGYTVELAAVDAVTVTLHKSSDGRTWREVSGSQIAVDAGHGTYRKALGVGATASARRHGRAAQGHRYYRIAVSGAATIADVGFWLDGSGTYRNAERVVLLYNYLLERAQRARARSTAPRISAARANVETGLVGPFRLSATDAAALSLDEGVLVTGDGTEITEPLASGSTFYLRPTRGSTSATITMTVPGAAGGHGGRVLTGVARDEASHRFTPLALVVPTQLVVDFDVDWTT